MSLKLFYNHAIIITMVFHQYLCVKGAAFSNEPRVPLSSECFGVF